MSKMRVAMYLVMFLSIHYIDEVPWKTESFPCSILSETFFNIQKKGINLRIDITVPKSC